MRKKHASEPRRVQDEDGMQSKTSLVPESKAKANALYNRTHPRTLLKMGREGILKQLDIATKALATLRDATRKGRLICPLEDEARILGFLEAGKEMTSSEIAINLKKHIGTIRRYLNKMEKAGKVEMIIMKKARERPRIGYRRVR